MLVKFIHSGKALYVRHDAVRFARDADIEEDEDGTLIVGVEENCGDVINYHFHDDEASEALRIVQSIHEHKPVEVTDG